MLDASSLSVISSLVDLDADKSLTRRRSGLQTSHCLNILRPSYRAVITNVIKQAPTKTETKNWKNPLSLQSDQHGIKAARKHANKTMTKERNREIESSD